MKSTGIVRKVDELGRIVLPIEMRRTLDIAEKDALEIYVDGEDIILHKYQAACVFCDSVKDITVITIILAFSGVFGYGIVFDNITVTIANALLGITSNSAILLLLVVVFLLICGMFMETTVIALILTPILLPVMRSIGVNEVVFGMIMMTTVTFGVMTPPVGTALYAVSDIMECPIEETFKKGWPFYLAVVGVILFMIFFPQAVLFLPNLVYGA